MSGRHRIKGVKREHSVISGLLPVLERIAANQHVTGVIPGRIGVTRGATPALQLRVGPRTVTGIKLTARRATVAQEVFVMSTDVEAFLVDLRDTVADLVE